MTQVDHFQQENVVDYPIGLIQYDKEEKRGLHIAFIVLSPCKRSL